jgi:dTDP-4-dehydrorhamnose reductase
LAQTTASRSILLIYISTDYVFPGRPGEAPYEATSPTDPPNLYGITKRDGENVVLETTRESGLGVVLRIPVLYGSANANSDSAVNILVDAVNKAQDPSAGIKMDDWSLRYPTNTEDVGRVCHDIAVKYLGERDKLASLPKILQFSSEDRMTKYQICEMLAEIMGVPLLGMIRVSEGPKPGDVQRPYDTHLSTKALQDLGIPVYTQDFNAWW